MPANEIEALVAKSVRDHLGEHAVSEDAVLIRDHVVRVEVRSDRLTIELASTKTAGAKRKRGTERIEVPWRKTPMTRRREILVPENAVADQVRPIRSENRALLIERSPESLIL